MEPWGNGFIVCDGMYALGSSKETMGEGVKSDALKLPEMGNLTSSFNQSYTFVKVVNFACN